MQNRKNERSVIQSLENTIGLKGVREDDEFALEAFQERKRVFRLKRTKYKIQITDHFAFDFTTATMSLPVFGPGCLGSFELILVPHVDSNNHNEKSRYLLKSTDATPFALNGTQCFEAFLERGDVVEIGFNRLVFLKPKSQLKIVEHENSLPIEMMKSSLNIMIEGETGTGKTTLAKKIHDESGRSGRFVHLNLSAFAPSLIESELFGHVKGAFTGAINEKVGAIVEANKGTLFLDEIDSLTLELQTKLLLFLDDYQVRPVGGSASRKVDVRLLFASGTKMKTLIDKEKMRRDFYYRLTSGVVLNLLSLRDEPHKIKEFCHQFEAENYVIISDELIQYYQECSWPGNIRQLLSHLKKKKIYANGKKFILDDVDHELLSDKANILKFEFHQMKSLEEIKMDYCLGIFLKSDKNFVKASKLLDISPNTLKALLNNREQLLRSH